jgi:hypothetical protein
MIQYMLRSAICLRLVVIVAVLVDTQAQRLSLQCVCTHLH